MKQVHKQLINLIRASADRTRHSLTDGNTNWYEVMDVAASQGMLAVAFESIESLPRDQRPPMDLFMDWLGQVEYCKEKYDEHANVIASLAEFYNSQAVRMLLLKGFGLSLDYPVQAHRPTGDIDIYLFGNKEFADQMAEQRLKVKVEREYHKHSHFNYKGITVENHEIFIDDFTHKSNIRFEKLLEDVLVAEMDNLVRSPIPYCWLPSATWNALFLLRHAGEHFAANEIKLRHIMDLGTFYAAHHADIDWNMVLNVYDDENMKVFYDSIATICVRDLGFEATVFHGYRHEEKVADRVLEDIFEKKVVLPNSTRNLNTIWEKSGYAIKKSARWYRNRWKYKMVYKESMLESFWGLAMNRIRN